jgi:hypothetical protein
MSWQLEEREFTVYCTLEVGVDRVWLEWNPRVFAYRCGVERPDVPSKSHLGYADSLEDAQVIALALLEGCTLGNSV